MSLLEPKTQYSGFTTLARGMDSGRAPSLISDDQVAFATNTSFRKGYPENRPGINRVTLTGPSFQLGRWQGACAYVAPTGQPSIIASIGGQIVRFDLFSNNVTNISAISGLSNPTIVPKTWMTQAEQFLVIQNGISIPLVFEGAVLRRANPVAFGGSELPVGCMMEYNNGRLWVVLPDRQSFVGGDLAYSVTGTSSDVLGFTENQFIDGGGAFVMPSNAGRITAVKTVAIMDTTLGQGPLQILGTEGSASLNAPFDRTLWQQTTSPIQSVSMLAPGPTSQESTVSVNGDLWYRSQDGIRSFQVGRRDHGTWVNTPLSQEMQRVLGNDDPYLMNFASAVDFDNRLLCTVSPYRATTAAAVEKGVAWRGIVALDFKPVSGMFDRGQPVWNGAWTGLQILQIIKVNCYGKDRCFIFALNATDNIELWELSKSDTHDENASPITWSIESKAMGFLDGSEALKSLVRTEQWFSGISGLLTWSIEYRPDGFWGWLPLDSGSVCATTGFCATPACGPLLAPQLQYRPRKITAGPDLDCETCVSKPYRNGFEFQFKLTMTGSAQLRRFRSVANDVPENITGGCIGETVCCSETGCESSPWEYVID